MTFSKFLLLVFFLTTIVSAQKSLLKTDVDSLSYSIGYSMGQNFRVQGLDLNLEVLAKSIKDALEGKRPVMSDDIMTNTIVTYQEKKRKERDEVLKRIGVKNLSEGESFLKKNKTIPGVKVTESGLQYRILTQGNGPSPKEADTVKVHYKGNLIDGREFDNSYKRGKPVKFEVIGVIPGWTEALQMMKVGDKWKLFIPSNLAYGKLNRNALIGPNTTLIFEVELLEIISGQ